MGKLPSPDHQLDDAVLLLVVDGKDLDPRNAFTITDKSAKDVVAKDLDPKGALETIGNPFTIVDVTVLDTRGALNEIGTSSKDVVAKDTVTREALFNNGSFFFTDDVAKVTLLWECSRKIQTPTPWLIELRDSELSSGRLYSLTAWRIM